MTKYNEDNLKKCGPAPRIKVKPTDYALWALVAANTFAVVVVLLDVFYWRAG